MLLLWLALVLSVARPCCAATFGSYTAAGLPRSGSVTGFYSFNDPANPLADTSGNNNHITDELSQTVTLVNLTGGYGDTMALDLRTTNPNRFRVPMTANVGMPTTICMSFRALRSRREALTYPTGINQPMAVYSLPKYVNSLSGLLINRANGFYLELFQDVDGGCHYVGGPMMRWAPSGGRFTQVCGRWYNGTDGLLVFTSYFHSKNFNTQTPCYNTYLGPSPFTGTNASVYLGVAVKSDGTFSSYSAPLQIDEVIVWKAALNDTEIQTYFNLSIGAQGTVVQGPTGNTTTPIAYFPFTGGSFASTVTNTYLGSFVPVGYVGSTAFIYPNPNPVNFSATLSTYSNVSNVFGDFGLGQEDALYVTTGGFGRNSISFCFNFRNQGPYLSLPCLDIDHSPFYNVTVGAPGVLGYCWAGNATSTSLSLYGTVTVTNAYTSNAWNRGCITADGSTFATVNYKFYTNGVSRNNRTVSWTGSSENMIFIENAGLQLPRSQSLFDEISVYDGIMSQAEVTADYNAFNTATAAPTNAPTISPTGSPTATPTALPTATPTSAPTAVPTALPTASPTSTPTAAPTRLPSASPTALPTALPSAAPTTATPTSLPSSTPTALPTASPTALPTAVPSAMPTSLPTAAPTTATPSAAPTAIPTAAPTGLPTSAPTAPPTSTPTALPTPVPTAPPTFAPTIGPSASPSSIPTASPTSAPSIGPSGAPTLAPTLGPTQQPSSVPTLAPTTQPSIGPSSIPSAAPTPVPTTSQPTATPVASPTRTPTTQGPTGAPSTAVPVASPTETPTEVPTLLSTTRSPTAAPTTGPFGIVVPVAVNVSSPTAPVTLVLGNVAVSLRLSNSNTSVLAVVRRLRAIDIASALQEELAPFPAGYVPVAGVMFVGEIAQTIAVTVDTTHASPYVAHGRTAFVHVSGLGWVDPGDVCIGGNQSTATVVDDVYVHVHVCTYDAILVVADPRGTTQRECPSGRFNCDCSATRAYDVAPIHRAFYLVSLILHAVASVFEFEYKGRDASLPFRAIAYALLIAAAVMYPLGDTDTTWTIGGLDEYALRYGLLVGPSVLAAAVFGIGAFYRWINAAVFISMEGRSAWIWVGYDPHPNEPELSVPHRLARGIHQILLAVSLAFAMELVGAGWSVAILVFLVGVFLEMFVPVAEKAAPACESLYYAFTRAIVAFGLLLCAAVLIAEPCGASYGADRPASILS